MARYCFQSQLVASGSEQTVTPRPPAIVSKIWSRSLRLSVTLLVLYLHDTQAYSELLWACNEGTCKNKD